MNWFGYAVVILLLWATYGLFAAGANEVHGQKISMLFEAGWFIAAALLVMTALPKEEYAKVTLMSSFQASAMAWGSLGGFWLLLIAIEKFPEKALPLLFVTGIYSTLSIIIGSLVIKFRPEWLPKMEQLTFNEKVSAAVIFVGLFVFNWKPEWTSKIKLLFS